LPLKGDVNNNSTDAKLDLVIKLLAAIYTKGSSNSDAITKLADLALSPMQIADIVGVSNHNVSQVLYANKKSGDKKKKKERPTAEGGTRV
jgi:hypothetical protein